jgi:homogentisate 1,2-dioxygenase
MENQHSMCGERRRRLFMQIPSEYRTIVMDLSYAMHGNGFSGMRACADLSMLFRSAPSLHSPIYPKFMLIFATCFHSHIQPTALKVTQHSWHIKLSISNGVKDFISAVSVRPQILRACVRLYYTDELLECLQYRNADGSTSKTRLAVPIRRVLDILGFPFLLLLSLLAV